MVTSTGTWFICMYLDSLCIARRLSYLPTVSKPAVAKPSFQWSVSNSSTQSPLLGDDAGLVLILGLLINTSS